MKPAVKILALKKFRRLRYKNPQIAKATNVTSQESFIRASEQKQKEEVKVANKDSDKSLTGSIIYFSTLLASVTFIFAFFFAAFVLFQTVRNNDILIRPISVPKDINESGITSQVEALKLSDALREFYQKYDDDRYEEKILQKGDLPEIIVPTIGVTMESVAAPIRDFFHMKKNRVVSGEVTKLKDLYFISLRLNGKLYYSSREGIDILKFNDLAAQAAEATVRAVNPQSFALMMMSTNRSLASLAIDEAINFDPNDIPYTVFSQILKGDMLISDKKYQEGKEQYAKAVLKASIDVGIHYTLGKELLERSQIDLAEHEFCESIRHEPSLALAYISLGEILSASERNDEAVTNLRIATDLDFGNSLAHQRLAISLDRVKQYGEALMEFRIISN